MNRVAVDEYPFRGDEQFDAQTLVICRDLYAEEIMRQGLTGDRVELEPSVRHYRAAALICATSIELHARSILPTQEYNQTLSRVYEQSLASDTTVEPPQKTHWTSEKWGAFRRVYFPKFIVQGEMPRPAEFLWTIGAVESDAFQTKFEELFIKRLGGTASLSVE